MTIVLSGTRKMADEIQANLRDTPEYDPAVLLISEKNAMQARLREVDKLLRKLDVLRPGVCALARNNIQFPVKPHLVT